MKEVWSSLACALAVDARARNPAVFPRRLCKPGCWTGTASATTNPVKDEQDEKFGRWQR